jgi:hypothetical protein
MSNEFNGFLFIGSASLSLSKPSRRVEDNYLDTIIEKLKFSLNLAKSKNLMPVFLGGLTLKTFELKVLTSLINILVDHNVLIIPDESDYIKGSESINPNSTIGVLQSSRIANIAEKAGLYKSICLTSKGKSKNVSIYVIHDWVSGEVISEHYKCFDENEVNIILTQYGSELIKSTSNGVIEPYDIKNCKLVMCGKTNSTSEYTGNETKWISPGLLSRIHIEQSEVRPVVIEWTPFDEPVFHEIPCAIHVMDMEGLASESVKNKYENSQFAKLLKDETIKSRQKQNDDDAIGQELNIIFSEKNASLDVREIILSIFDVVQKPLLSELDE